MSLFSISYDKIIKKLEYRENDIVETADFTNYISETYFDYAPISTIMFEFWGKKLSASMFIKAYENDKKKINNLLTLIPYATTVNTIIYGDAVLFIDKINFNVNDVEELLNK